MRSTHVMDVLHAVHSTLELVCWGKAGGKMIPLRFHRKSSGLTPSPADHTLENSINGLIKAGEGQPLDR